MVQYRDKAGRPQVVPVEGPERSVTISPLDPDHKYTMTLCSDQTQTPSLTHSLELEGEEALHCPIILMYQMEYNHTELQEQS